MLYRRILIVVRKECIGGWACMMLAFILEVFFKPGSYTTTNGW